MEGQEQPQYKEPPLALHGDAGAWDHRPDDEDYFSQPGDLFRLMTDDKKELLFKNTAAEVGHAVRVFDSRENLC